MKMPRTQHQKKMWCHWDNEGNKEILNRAIINCNRSMRAMVQFVVWQSSNFIYIPLISFVRNKEWLVSCAEVREEAGFERLSQLFLSLFMWTTECNTMNIFQERQWATFVPIFKQYPPPPRPAPPQWMNLCPLAFFNWLCMQSCRLRLTLH